MKFLFMAVIPWCALLIFILYQWCNKLDNAGGYEKGSAPYKYNKPRTKSKYIKYKPPGRKRPPNASFFGRLDGKDISVEGPYEEKWLTIIESIKWQRKKAKIKREKGL